jgi:hypothetical protein
MYSSVNDLLEDGLQRPKHVGEASQNKNIFLWLHVKLVELNNV